MKFRLRDYIRYPLQIKRERNFLEKSQFWSEDERRKWSQEKLDKILWHAVNHVPYYKKTFAAFKPKFNDMIDRLDLSQLPILTKDIIRQNQKALVADNAYKYNPHPDRTSGSTGAPMEFLLDSPSDLHNFASIWRVLNWTGYKFSNRFASIIPNMEKHTTREFIYDFKQNC